VWDLPGGHVEANESADAALMRELREELGVELAWPLGQPFRRFTDRAIDMEMTVWVIEYDGPAVNRAPHEHDEIRWVDADEITNLHLAHPDYADMFAQALAPGRQAWVG